MTDTQLDALLYGRQSQNKDRSIAEQLDLGRDRAAPRAGRCSASTRTACSASRHATKKRDEWPRVLARIDAGQGDVLWLWESSRGDRKLSTWARLLEDCRDRAVRIYVETHGRLYDMANSRDWRTLADDGVDNEAETNKTSERVLRAMTANADGREGPRPGPLRVPARVRDHPARAAEAGRPGAR